MQSRAEFDPDSARFGPGSDTVQLLSLNTDPLIPGFWKVVMKDGTILSFPMSQGSTTPFCQAITGIQDRYGNQVAFTRDGSCHLSQVVSPNGRSISFTNDPNGRITSATDNSGRTVQYAYDTAGHLSTVTDAAGGVTTYTYDGQNRMLTIKDPRGIVYLTNQYDSFGRVIQQTNADGGTYQFAWTSSLNSTQAHFFNEAVGLRDSGCYGNNGMNRYNPACLEGYMPLVQQVDVTDPRGYVRRVAFGSTGYMTSDTHALGQPEQQAVTYAYYADNTLQSVTDALGRVTSFDYDAAGNVTFVTRLSGTPNSVTTGLTYEPQFNQLSSVIDPLGHAKTFHYDQNGNMTSASDALNHVISVTYNGAGLVTQVTDAANQSVQFGYFGGDLVSKADPLGNVTTEFRDTIGRITKITDALGESTSMQHDALNRVQQVTDPQGHVSSYTYDANGNPLTLSDASGHTTTYTFDVMDRRATRTDALLRQESLTYDLNGNVVTATDRKGQVTVFTYDALNRLINTCFNQTTSGGVPVCESTVSYQYDLPNRRTIITDSLAGVITKTFDDLGRLISEVNPQSSVTYTYDADDRVTGRTVNNQLPFTYSYNAIGQLLSISQGTQSAQFGYDSGGRASTLMLPNGVVATYGYDGGSHLTEISYSRNQTAIGYLTYGYDALNRRVSVGGSLAATLLPAPLTSATYDAANQIASWNGTAMAYDPNGNLVNDGQSSYAWDARGHLIGISGAVNATFAYDALGRRIAKTIGPSALGFVYDGNGITQEMAGSTVTATLWSGGSNGFVQRTDASGAIVPLTDGLGSVIALADANGNLQTQYVYEPFGNTVATGVPSSNEFQYIGRENDLTGLYYMHARYYSPALMRFISEDPLGFGGGDVNLHAYSYGSPTNLSDPSGMNPMLINCAVGAAMDVSFNLIADYLSRRKTAVSDAFSMTTLGYAAEGCASGFIGGILGDLVIAPLIDIAAPYAARLFTTEAAESASSALNILDSSFVPDAQAVLQNIVDAKAAELAADPAIAQTVLSQAEIAASESAQIAPMSYGNAMERLVGQEVDQNFGSLLTYTGRGAGPDFAGVGNAAGEYFELTTPGAIGAHLARPYGPWLDFVTYVRPSGFIGF